MTSNDIQLIVFRHLMGRYQQLTDNDEYLLLPIIANESDLAFPRSYVVRVTMVVGDFRQFRLECYESGVDIIAVYKIANSTEPTICDYVIIATERL